MKSVLREITHTAAIPIIADPWRDDEDESAKGKRIISSRRARVRAEYAAQHAALDPRLRPYLLNRQHDSFIQQFRREGDRFTITALDGDADMLVHWNSDPEEWNTDGLPFELVFEGVEYVGWRRILDDATLAFSSEPQGVAQWLSDGFLDIHEPGVRWALQYWMSDAPRGSGYHLLLVEARSMHVIERQRDEWIQRFGKFGLKTYDRYHAVRSEMALAHLSAVPAEFDIQWPEGGAKAFVDGRLRLAHDPRGNIS